MSQTRRQFTPEFRAAAVERYKTAGETLKTIAAEFDIVPSLLGTWVRGRARLSEVPRKLRKRRRPVAPRSLIPTEDDLDAESREAIAFVAGQCYAGLAATAERVRLPVRTLARRVGALLQRQEDR